MKLLWSSSSSVRAFALSCTLLFLGGCSAFWGAPPEVTASSRQEIAPGNVINLFPSDLKLGEAPEGWEKWIIHPLKRKTDYGWKRDKKGVFVEARSASSASGLIKRLDLAAPDFPVLQFSWTVDNLLEGADAGDRELEDSPVRVVLAFDGDKSTLPPRDRMFIERVKTFTGQDLPYATLMYIWDNNRAIGTVITNPHTQRVRKIVASTGPAGLLNWQDHQRNIVEDYRLAYGKDPGRLIGVAIMTDTDNTRTSTRARYRALTLKKSQETLTSDK